MRSPASRLIAVVLIAVVSGLGGCDDPEPTGSRAPARRQATVSDEVPAADVSAIEQAFIEGVTRAVPGATVARQADGRLRVARGDRELLFNPTSLREECRRSPTSCPQSTEAAVDTTVRTLTEPESESLDLANLRMVLQSGRLLRAEAPHMMDASWPLAGDLRWHFVIDRPESIASVGAEALERLGGDREALEARARANMRDALGPLRYFAIPDTRGVYSIDASGGGLASDSYDAARLLLHDAWEPLTAVVEGELVAAAPARDTAIFAGTGTPGAIDTLRYLATSMSRGELHPISPQLVRWTPEGWVAF